jgi:hypothetical protein
MKRGVTFKRIFRVASVISGGSRTEARELLVALTILLCGLPSALAQGVAPPQATNTENVGSPNSVDAHAALETGLRELMEDFAKRKTQVAEYRAAPYELISHSCPVLQDVLDDLAKDFSDPARVDVKTGAANTRVSEAILMRMSNAALDTLEELFRCVKFGLVERNPSENEKQQGAVRIFVGDIPVAYVKAPVSEKGPEFMEIEAYARLLIMQRADGTLIISGEYLFG